MGFTLPANFDWDKFHDNLPAIWTGVSLGWLREDVDGLSGPGAAEELSEVEARASEWRRYLADLEPVAIRERAIADAEPATRALEGAIAAARTRLAASA